jgi:hypothetical protein
MGIKEILDDKMVELLRSEGFEVVHVGPTLEHHHGAITLVGSSGGLPIGTMRQDEETGLWEITPDTGGGVTGGETTTGSEESSGGRGPTIMFAARCDSFDHAAGDPGVSSDGRWFGSVFDTEEAAQRQAAEHNQAGHAAVVSEVEER